jgi:hypothetical protein
MSLVARSGMARPALIASGFADPYIFVNFPEFLAAAPAAAPTLPEHV